MEGYFLNGITQAGNLLLEGDAATFSAIYASIASASMSTLGAIAVGAPLGAILGYFRFPARKFCRLLVNTLLSFPTVVIGLLVYILISRQGPLGGLELLFTLPGITLGLFILALPIVIALTSNAVESCDRNLAPTLLTLGASKSQMLATTLWELRFSLFTTVIFAFSRVVSEVGISMIVGGNIKWHTRTITTAISLETGKGEFAQGIALGMVMLLLCLGINLLLAMLKSRSRV